MLVISNFLGDIDLIKEKKGIFLTSRVHPGETNASFVIEGIIKFLTGNSPEAKILRDNFMIRVLLIIYDILTLSYNLDSSYA